jgi:hypothetical protein
LPPGYQAGTLYMWWRWMDMQWDEIRGLRELRKYESHGPNTVSPPCLDSRSVPLQHNSGGSPIASPQLQEALKRRWRVVLVVVVGVGEDRPALLQKTPHQIRPPQQVFVPVLL